MTTLAFSPGVSTYHRERDPETVIGPGAKLILKMNRGPDDGGGDSVAGDDLRLILDLVDDAHDRGIIGRLGHDWKANDEKKGKLAQRLLPLARAVYRPPAIGWVFSGRGGIGRHARFRFWWLRPWGFESLRPHQSQSSGLGHR
jgi:hypothetical protein